MIKHLEELISDYTTFGTNELERLSSQTIITSDDMYYFNLYSSSSTYLTCLLLLSANSDTASQVWSNYHLMKLRQIQINNLAKNPHYNIGLN